MGGAWKRIIRTIKRILNALLLPVQQMLTDDSLITVLAEVKSIINSRPLTMGKWPIGKVIQTFPDKSRRVRQVLMQTQFNTLFRPVTKLCEFLPEELCVYVLGLAFFFSVIVCLLILLV